MQKYNDKLQNIKIKYIKLKQDNNKELENKLKSININVNNLEEIIKQKNNELNNLNNLNKELENKKNFFGKSIQIKDKELERLKEELNNIKKSPNKFFKIVNIISNDEHIFFSIPCSGDTKFFVIEDLFYKEYPEYHEISKTFYNNGKKIIRNKTIDENKIVARSPVIFNIHS